MSIKRYVAIQDTEITNAFKSNLTERGDDSNMGLADSLSVFTIYNQSQNIVENTNFTKSVVPLREESRILLEFDAETIDGDWDEYDDIDDVQFMLRLFNAEHPFTLPRGFYLEVYTLDTAFDEGVGIDADEYSDEGAASWNAASNTPETYASGSYTVVTNPDGSFEIHVGGYYVDVTPHASDVNQTAANILTAINTDADISNVVLATRSNAVVTITARASNGNVVPYTAFLDVGDAGQIDTAGTTMSGGVDTTDWDTPGGDLGDFLGRVYFDDGDEDLELDISSEVQTWISGGEAGDPSNHLGLIILMGSDEADATRSYYTKKFFARGSEYFFKRPIIEARWDDSIRDDRGRFYAESNLLGDTDNTNELYLRNRFNGTLKDISGDPSLSLKLYASSSMAAATELSDYTASVTKEDTGIYRADVIADTTESVIYDKWYKTGTESTVYFSGSMNVLQREAVVFDTLPSYIVEFTNMKAEYDREEVARLRLYSRRQDAALSVYTVATEDIDTTVLDDVYYKVIRKGDEITVVDYGYASPYHTRMSRDVSGSYFDLDMSLLDDDYTYAIKLMIVQDGELRELPNEFVFRVLKDDE
jgi:hypothetical protein